MQRFLFRALRTGALLCWLLLLLAHSSRAASPTILVLGDSLSAAYGMSLEQGWVALMEARLAPSHPQLAVVNASISGETSAGGLRRLPALLAEHRPDLVIIELGGNDGLRGFPLATLRGNLTNLVQLAQQAGARVVLVPIEIPPNYGARYTAGFRDTYREVARDTGSLLAPFILEQVALDPGLMQDDGIHPTAAAQATLLATILPTIEQALAGP